MKNIKFPKGFLWGSATSAHQVEGGNFNSDWYKWEIKGHVKNKDTSKITCDFWHTYKDDLKLAKKLGQNAFRFSIEWAKIEPAQGKFNKNALKHYQDVINECRKLGIEPFITLHHFTNPIWFSKLGAWKNPRSPVYFQKYVKTTVEYLKNVKFWITINEPLIFSTLEYYEGKWPPREKSLFSLYKVIQNLIRSHKFAYAVIKKHNPKAQISIAKNNQYFEPYKNWLDKILTRKVDYFWNDYFLDKIKDQLDFIGLNYYFHNRLHFNLIRPFIHRINEDKITTDMGWEYYPEGMYKVLLKLKKYNLPIYITENGVADTNDNLRERFIIEHLKYVHKAIGKGVNVKGYMHWSLLDNFEWDSGFGPKFGLIKVNFKTQKRSIRKSALAYKKVCVQNQISSKILVKYNK